MPHEVSEFIVVAPANQAKAVEWAERRLAAFLETHFPLYSFRIDPFGPLSDDDRFTVIPVMSARPDRDDRSDKIRLLSLDPNVIPEICDTLRSFDLTGAMTH
ncbi:hypothetical protein [Devosia sp. A449]